MMIGRFGVVKLWRFDDKEFLQSSFAVCCFVVETETLVHHGLGTRYASVFDTDAAEANAAELLTFTNRYKKKVQEQKKVKEQKVALFKFFNCFTNQVKIGSRSAKLFHRISGL